MLRRSMQPYIVTPQPLHADGAPLLLLRRELLRRPDVQGRHVRHDSPSTRRCSRTSMPHPATARRARASTRAVPRRRRRRDVIDASQCIYEVPPGTSVRDLGLNVRVIYEPSARGARPRPSRGLHAPRPDEPEPLPTRARSLFRRRAQDQEHRREPHVPVQERLPAALREGQRRRRRSRPRRAPCTCSSTRTRSMVDYIGTKNTSSTSTDKSAALDDALALALGDPVFMTTQLAFRFVPTPGSECSRGRVRDARSSASRHSLTISTGDRSLLTHVHRQYAPDSDERARAQRRLSSTRCVTACSTPIDPATTRRHRVQPQGGRHRHQSHARPEPTHRTARAAAQRRPCKPPRRPASTRTSFSLRNALETPPATQARIDAATAFATASGAERLRSRGRRRGRSEHREAAGRAGHRRHRQLTRRLPLRQAEELHRPSGGHAHAQARRRLRAGHDPARLDVQRRRPRTADGWTIEGSHIRVCGASCTTIRAAIAQDQLLTAQRNQGNFALSGQVLVQLTVP